MSSRVIQGDCRAVLRSLPAESVHCCVTSPPYFSLRTYDTDSQVWGGSPECEHAWGAMERGKRKDILPADVTTLVSRVGTDGRQGSAGTNGGRFCLECGAWRGELGGEPSPELYVEHLVEIFREVRRVLRPDGTLWLVIGDSFATHARGHNGFGSSALDQAAQHYQETSGIHRRGDNSHSAPAFGLKDKDLIGIPWRVAFALQSDGWWLRGDIVWGKTAPMPESVTDRPTRAHEYVFLLTRSRRYFYDAAAIAEPVTESTLARISQPTFDQQAGGKRDYGAGSNRSARRAVENLADKQAQTGKRTYTGFNDRWSLKPVLTRNKRDVWTLGPQPFTGGPHYAVMPEALVEPCILAGTSEHGCCSVCLAPWKRVKERTNGSKPTMKGSRFDGGKTGVTQGERVQKGNRTMTVDAGWEPTCKHPDAPVVPAVVLDPFSGAGTTLVVARRLGRDGIGIELNPEYVAMSEDRIARTQPALVPVREDAV